MTQRGKLWRYVSNKTCKRTTLASPSTTRMQMCKFWNATCSNFSFRGCTLQQFLQQCLGGKWKIWCNQWLEQTTHFSWSLPKSERNWLIVGDKGHQLEWALVQNRHAGFYKLKKQRMSTSQGSLDFPLFWMSQSGPCHPTRRTLLY